MRSGTTKKENTVQQRLVHAAAGVFAEKGFSQATIREICRRADANVAAVSYYWRDKESLYRRVIEDLITEQVRNYPLTDALDASLRPEAQLKKFVELFLRRLLETDRPARLAKIMVREMNEPTEAIGAVFDKSIKPTFDVLTTIVQAVGEDTIERKQVQMAVVSIISQCVFYFNARNIMDKMTDGELLPDFDLGAVVEHITNFSLKGLGADAP
jgi:AcrR family transcriptional regulator